MRSWARLPSRLKVATVAVVVVVVALIGVLASQRFDTDKTASRAGNARPTPAPTVEAKPVSKTVDLGEAARISSNYTVTVTDATVYEGGQRNYIVATVEAEYIGDDEGDPWADLIVEFSTPESQAVDESGCPADIRESNASDPPPMATGDVESYAVCFDLPSSDVDGGKVTVEEAFTDGDRVSWSTEGAVTKTLPSPTPRPTVAQAPAQQVPQAQDDSDSDTYDSDDIEEYRDDLDEAIEKYEKQRDNIKAQLRAWKQAGYDGDGVEDYEEWLEDVEEAIDAYKEQRDKLPD